MLERRVDGEPAIQSADQERQRRYQDDGRRVIGRVEHGGQHEDRGEQDGDTDGDEPRQEEMPPIGSDARDHKDGGEDEDDVEGDGERPHEVAELREARHVRVEDVVLTSDGALLLHVLANVEFVVLQDEDVGNHHKHGEDDADGAEDGRARLGAETAAPTIQDEHDLSHHFEAELMRLKAIEGERERKPQRTKKGLSL